MEKCELCSSPAKMYCESDQARLCWDCDTRVHGANFLVAKHTRTLLCQICQAPTLWNGSGPKLGPTISVCNVCVGTNSSCSGEHNHEDEVDDDADLDRDDDGDGDGDDHDDDNNSGDDGGSDEEEEEEENQVVPWTSTPPPLVWSSSTTSTEEGLSKLCNGEEGTSASNITFSMNPMPETTNTNTKFGLQDHPGQGYCASASQPRENMYRSNESQLIWRPLKNEITSIDDDERFD